MRSTLPLFAIFILSFFPHFGAADEMPNFYGTFTIEKTLRTETKEIYKKGDAYFPGERVIVDEATWSGKIRYLPGKRRIASGQHYRRHFDDRKTQSTTECSNGSRAENHDYETIEVETRVSNTGEGKSGLSIYIGDDGAYDFQEIFGLRSVRNGESTRHVRDIFEGCRKDPSRITKYQSKMFGTVPGVTIKAKAVASPLPPDGLSGAGELIDDDGGLVKFTWNLTRAVPKLVAVISGPSSFIRGDLVSLDGSQSHGDVTDYTWTFVFSEDCKAPPENPMLELKGPRVSFHALCSFEAHLSVKDSMGDSANDTLALAVNPREGEQWKTKFASKVGAPVSSRMTLEWMQLGINQCSKHSSADITAHLIHTNAANNATWIDDGYIAEQLSDGGPFNGMWFVKSQTLEIDRLERANAAFSNEGSEFYVLNKTKNNLSDVKALASQIKDHEKMHSTLIDEALQRLGPKGDPAAEVEAVVAPSKDLLQFLADMKVREVETILRDATSDDNVKNRLQTRSDLRRSVKIWVPTIQGDVFLKDLGPLWGIGD